MTTPAAVAFSVCVYCGSRPGDSPRFLELAQAVGSEIGRRGWRLVYGGGRVGLMGAVADAALAAGAQVLGVIPQTLMRREVGHARLTELQVVQTMHERKQRMAEAADAFLALPGGIGTFEELFEAWTWRQLGYHAKPLGLLDADGYYAPLLEFLHGTVQRGFLDAAQLASLQVGDDAAALLQRLHDEARAARADYSRI
jgi:uncharacterized protein (TIGR00730 family)